MLLLSFLHILLLVLVTAEASVIPPAWADLRYNPCAKASWQSLFWKADGKCYPIFKQGHPCPATLELVFDVATKEAKCQCPSGRLYWEEDGRCYEPYTQGPCPEGDFLHPGQSHVSPRGLSHRADPHRRTLQQVQAWLGQHQPDQHGSKLEPLGFVHCKQKGYCPANWGFWPATELCYPFHTQGPCQSGSIFRWNPGTEQAECSCHSPASRPDELSGNPAGSWRPYYWPISATCHEHFTMGPCRFGEVFIFNQTTQATQCQCSKHLNNYHPETGQCFEKYTRGPCSPGMWLISHPHDLPQYSMPASMVPIAPRSAFSNKSRPTKHPKRRSSSSNRRNAASIKSLTCACLPGFVYSSDAGQCYREYTQGPCRNGYIFIRADDEEVGTCWKNPCGRQELYLPDSLRCFKIHSQGPCPEGQLVLADDQHGIGYRGHCGCSPTNVQHYWPLDGKCYAHETRGPCRGNTVFSIRSGDGLTPSCTCPAGQVFFNTTRMCYKPYSQGPCAWNEWLAPSADVNDVVVVRSSSEDGSYACQCKPGYAYQSGSTFCQPPSLELLFSLPSSGTQRTQQQQPQ